MAFELYLTPGTVPANTALPGTAQALINMVAEYVLIAGVGDVRGINYGSSEPSPENRDMPWWKTNSDGNPVGMFNWNGSAWVTVNIPIPSGPTSARPLDASEGTLFDDTTINAALIFNRGQWRTVSGSPGDLKETIAATIDIALQHNPGWLQHTDSNGCVIGGAGANAARSLTTRTFNEFVGEEQHTLLEGELPAHTHPVTANWGSGGEGGGDSPLYYDNAQGPASPQAQPDSGPVGDGTPFNVMGPTLFYWRLVKQ